MECGWGNKIPSLYMILFCTFKSLIKIVEPKNTEFLCGKVVSVKSAFYDWRRRKKKNSWTLYNKFSRENSAKIFFPNQSSILQTSSDSFSLVFFVGIIAIYDRK